MLLLHALVACSRSLRPLSLIVALALVVAASPASATSNVRWYRFDGCEPALSSFASQNDPERISCGALGVFYVGEETLEYSSACSHSVYGVEAPALYLAQDDPLFSPAAGEWFPCAQGGCFGRRGQPWVGIVDWNRGHGWSVAGTIAASAGPAIDLELFALDAGGATLDPQGVSDLDVLAQLCAVAERAELQPNDLPLVVNLSFGRILDAGASGAAQSRGQVALQDQIHEVLRHLDQDLDIHLVAAGGNHGELLFPASDPHVMAVGAIDIEGYAQTSTIGSAPRSPSQSTAWLPAYGLYLEESTGGVYWPVPPGSSYASALASGWLAGFMVENSLSRDALGLSAASTLEPVASGNDYLLVLDGQTLAGSALPGATELTGGALEHASGCGSLPASPTVVPSVETTSALPAESSAQISARDNLPLPNTRPCVPCHGFDTIDGLVIDVSESEGFPDDQTLDRLVLRAGSTYREVTDPTILADFADGLLDSLRFENVGPIASGTTVELIYSLRLPTAAVFWDATPVHMHP